MSNGAEHAPVNRAAKPEFNKNELNAWKHLHAEAPTTDGRSIDEVYEDFNANSKVSEEYLSVNKPVVNVLHMSELMLGHKDSDFQYYRDTIDRIKNLPETEKPDLIVLSGLINGDYKYEGKMSGRITVAEESMGRQWQYAHDMLERAREIGAPILYNMGDDDHRINKEYTVVQFKRIKDQAKQHEKKLREGEKLGKMGDDLESNTSLTSWGLVNAAQTDERWTANLRFQNDIIFPWCMRAGRRLYVAEEMEELTQDWAVPITVDEYFVIKDIENSKNEHGDTYRRHLSNSNARWLREVSEARGDGKKQPPLIITDDVNLHIATESRNYTDWIRHSFNPTSTTLPQAFMKKPMDILGQMAANGEETPDTFITQQNLELTGAVSPTANGAAVIFDAGGMIDTVKHMHTQGIISDFARDRSKRALRGRGRVARSTSSTHTRKDSGEYAVTFNNRKLWDKADSLPERITIAELCDTQLGSISARPDMTVKYLDYIRVRCLGERPTALMFAGDHIQGYNYGTHPIESQQVGMISVATQKEFLRKMLTGAWGDMTTDEINAIERINIQTGNHEYNSGAFRGSKYPNGDTFVDYIKDHFARQYARAGYSDAQIDELVKIQEAFVTPTGEYVYGPLGYEKYGDYGMLSRHFYLGRFAKSGGDLPVYQAAKFVNAQGPLFKDIDLMAGGHWHSPQFLEQNNKISYLGGAMAGLTMYEGELGLRGKVAGALAHLGGGLPPTIEFIPQATLANWKIRTGVYADKNLRDMGYEDDPDFNALSDGFYAPEGVSFPKSALQKYLRVQEREASQRTGNLVRF